MAAKRLAGADRFNCWDDAENKIGHFLFAVGAGVQDPQIDREMLPVVGREALCPGYVVDDTRRPSYVHWFLPSPF